MNVLAIGNSYSEDGTRYVHQLAESCGEIINITNLVIGGCTLERHFRNMHSEGKVYQHEFNGMYTGLDVSLKEALLIREWDVITIQQQSFNSTKYDTFQPYLNELVAYIRKLSPKAKIALQQTWGYRDGEKSLRFYENGSAMFADIKSSYARAAEEIQADMIIKSGEVFEGLKANGVYDYFRDPIHASLGLGRYALGLMWVKTLTGKSPYETGEIRLDQEVSKEHLEIAKKVVEGIKTAETATRLIK